MVVFTVTDTDDMQKQIVELMQAEAERAFKSAATQKKAIDKACDTARGNAVLNVAYLLKHARFVVTAKEKV